MQRKRCGMILLFAMAVLFCAFLHSASVSAEAKSGTVNAEPLNVRTGWGTSYAVLKSGGSKVQLYKGNTVSIQETKTVSGKTWYKVTFTKSGSSYTGYVCGDYVTVSTSGGSSGGTSGGSGQTSSGTNATVTAGPLNVRTGYGTSNAVMKQNGAKVQLAKGTKVTASDPKTVGGVTWYKVVFTRNGSTITGYVSGQYLKVEVGSTGSTGGSGSDSGPGTSDGSNQGASGAETTENKTGVVTGGPLNVRTGYGTSNPVMKQNGAKVQLSKDATVKIIGSKKVGSTTWYQVSFTRNGQTITGYVSGDYVRISDGTSGGSSNDSGNDNAGGSSSSGSSKGKLIVIDAGHQRKANTDKEPLGPGSSEMKKKVSSGTAGKYSKLNEYELNLILALKLQKILEDRGYTVKQIRTSHDVNISNVERAEIANQAGADAFIRIHADGSENTSVHGCMTICQTKKNPWNANLYSKSQALSKAVVDELAKATGAKNNGIWETDTMTGINWCTVPVTIVEVGYMSNPDEDKKLGTESYQDKIAEGIANGIDLYFKNN